jgi:hypothetical protein
LRCNLLELILAESFHPLFPVLDLILLLNRDWLFTPAHTKRD